MNWALVRPALLAAVQTVTGLSTGGRVAWKGSKEASVMRAYPRVDLSVRSIVSVGDEVRKVVRDDGAKDVAVSGPRRFVWSIRIESDSQTDAVSALTYEERIRTRLNRPAMGDAMRAVGVSIAEIQASQTVDFKLQDRELSVCVIDVLMNGVSNDADDTVGAGDVIESAHVYSNELLNVDGTPTSTQIDEEVTAEA
jgi:hypothetical protein